MDSKQVKKKKKNARLTLDVKDAEVCLRNGDDQTGLMDENESVVESGIDDSACGEEEKGR